MKPLLFMIVMLHAIALPANTPSTDAMQTRSLVAVDGGHIEVLSQGAGPLVVMLPSLGRGASDFDDLAGRLQPAGYRVVRPQPRGVGDSNATLDGVSFADLAADVAAVIAADGAGPAVIIGHAFGNRVARLVAARHPDHVRGVILLAAGGKIEIDPGIERSIARSFDYSLPEGERMAAVEAAFFASGNDASVWRDGWHGATALMQDRARRTEPVEAWWGGGDVPMLAIHPLQDRVAPAANYELLEQAAPGRVTIEKIDGAGHALLPERPEQVSDAVIAFLRRLDGR